jgi:uncharacterized protein (DUF305 family)
MKARVLVVPILSLLLFSTAQTLAQHQHGSSAPVPAQGQGAATRPAEADGMMSVMRRMMPMMEQMRTASPAERESIMAQMRPLMQEMMPMMQEMMGPHAMGPGRSGMMGRGHQGQPPAAATLASTRAFEEVNAKMHRDMAITFTGNADVDFVRGMIPHHQGAIDMARVVLEHGRDETTRKWANDIIREQEREIAEMREWLARNAR